MKYLLIPTTLFATALFAQGPGGPRMHRMEALSTTEVQNYLNLTSAQIQSLKQLHQSEMTALKPVFQQLRPLHESLRTADAASATTIKQQIQSLQQQMAATRSSFQQQALAVLTPDQKTKMTALESAAALLPTIHEAMSLGLLTPPKGMGGGLGAAPDAFPRWRSGATH